MEITENKAVNDFIKLAKNQGFKMDAGEEQRLYKDCREPQDEIDIYLELGLSTGETYDWCLSLDCQADEKEISDQLYMFAEDFEQEFVESDLVQELRDDYGYSEEEIDEIRSAFIKLYKEHLAMINNY